MTFRYHTRIKSMDCSSDTATATTGSENSVIDQHLEAELLMKIVTGRFVNMSTCYFMGRICFVFSMWIKYKHIGIKVFICS